MGLLAKKNRLLAKVVLFAFFFATPVASTGGTPATHWLVFATAVTHGGNPQDRAASPLRETKKY